MPITPATRQAEAGEWQFFLFRKGRYETSLQWPGDTMGHLKGHKHMNLCLSTDNMVTTHTHTASKSGVNLVVRPQHVKPMSKKKKKKLFLKWNPQNSISNITNLEVANNKKYILKLDQALYRKLYNTDHSNCTAEQHSKPLCGEMYHVHVERCTMFMDWKTLRISKLLALLELIWRINPVSSQNSEGSCVKW